MKIDLKSLRDEVNYLSLEGTSESLELKAEGVEFPEPIKVDLRVLRSGKNYVGQGKVETVALFECSRCLKKYYQTLKADIRFLLKEEKDQIILESEDRESLVQTGSFFKLDDLVRESLILSIPLKSLCKEDCKGFCPVCGTDLNVATCKCKKEQIDPRWEKLRDLKSEKSKK
jgi:uncharacterized protein